jgi:DNA-binding NarL/FixJ family response regulator
MTSALVFVAIQQSVFRRAVTAYLRSLPGALNIRPLGSLVELLPAVDRECPDILVLDSDLWEEGSCAPPVDLLAILRRACPRLCLIVLASSDDQAAQCLAAGVRSALQKGCLDARLGDAIASCLRDMGGETPHEF